MYRGVTRLDGARCIKQVWRSHVRTSALSEANLLYWRKCLWQMDFSATQQWFGARGIASLRPWYAVLLYSHVMFFVRTIQGILHLHDFMGVSGTWYYLTLVNGPFPKIIECPCSRWSCAQGELGRNWSLSVDGLLRSARIWAWQRKYKPS